MTPDERDLTEAALDALVEAGGLIAWAIRDAPEGEQPGLRRAVTIVADYADNLRRFSRLGRW